MRTRVARPRAAYALLSALVLWSLPASGDKSSTATCIQAAEKAQTQRAAGKLGEARAVLITCSREECPAVVRRDCAQWMTDVLAAQPSVVFAARGALGRDLIAVEVSIDGSVVAASLDGRATPIDPGRHLVRMEAAGYISAEEVVLVREGEKERQILLTLSPMPAAQTAPPPSPSPSGGQPTVRPERPVPTATYLSAAVGIAALGVAAYFDVKGTSGALRLKDTCGSRCASSDVDPLRADYHVAQAAAGAGVLALGVALILYLTRPSAQAQAAGATPLRVAY